MQEQAQATHWLLQFLQDNAVWIVPIVLALLDALFHKLPVKYQSVFKKGYDLLIKRLKKK